MEVSPSSFQKIKLLGKGDVGKVYLVKEKKTDKLFAMKGKLYGIESKPRQSAADDSLQSCQKKR